MGPIHMVGVTINLIIMSIIYFNGLSLVISQLVYFLDKFRPT